ncbi:MAG: cardiolipin synthase [Phycisphaerales bacterium]|jgi:cardiolipin synthase|nr:cardiolipin synthase [Phycisphaerales bacterium]
MTLQSANDIIRARALGSPDSDTGVTRPRDPNCAVEQGDLGTSGGVNIAPGSDDDGWTVPQPVELSDGTRLQLYKDGEALHAAYDAIKNAKKRICLEVYIFADDDTGRAFADLLCEKAQQGVKVYVIYDSFGSHSVPHLWKHTAEIFKKMRRSGVRLAEFHPIRPWEGRFGWRPVNRDHRKLLHIDDDISGLGGLNVGGEYAGSWVVPSKAKECDLWRDNAVGIVGPASRILLQSFAATWRYIHTGGRMQRAELYHPLGDGEFGLLASVPSMHSQLTQRLRDVLKRARHSIEMTMAYFAPPDELIDGLCKAAKRGVRVRLMLPGRGDVRLLITAARSFYEKLLPAGVEIYERQHVILHAKTMCIDNEYTVMGSTNLDYRSIEYNLELAALIKSKPFGQQMHDLFENDVRYAHRISLKEWRKRPLLDRFGQWAVNRARYLL